MLSLPFSEAFLRGRHCVKHRPLGNAVLFLLLF